MGPIQHWISTSHSPAKSAFQKGLCSLSHFQYNYCQSLGPIFLTLCSFNKVFDLKMCSVNSLSVSWTCYIERQIRELEKQNLFLELKVMAARYGTGLNSELFCFCTNSLLNCFLPFFSPLLFLFLHHQAFLHKRLVSQI